jgi:Polyketide cyclase / dehydrase and lipid transport
MTQIQVSAEGPVAAPADEVYSYIADYHTHHPRILPPAFTHLQVEEGGMGDGTVVSTRLKVGGRTYSYRLRVTEPIPGRELKERDVTTGQETTFTVTPDGTGRSRVRIETRWEKSGIAGIAERLFAPYVTRKIFRQEIGMLDAYARGQSVAAPQTA